MFVQLLHLEFPEILQERQAHTGENTITKNINMGTPYYQNIILLAVLFVFLIRAQPPSRSPWQYMRGQIAPVLRNPAWVNNKFNCSQPCTSPPSCRDYGPGQNCVCTGHGDPNEYLGVRTPLANESWLTCRTSDSYCKNADDIDIVGPSASRLNKACGSNRYPNGDQCPCQENVDYSWFQTFVIIPIGATVTSFAISFTNMDDGSLVTIYNPKYPDGIFIPGSYVQYCAQKLTTNLVSYLVTGSNRIVITQIDDCPTGNNIQASVVINGQFTPPSCNTVQCQNGTWSTSQQTCIYTPLPNGASCTDYNLCTTLDSCSAGNCVGRNPLTCTAPDICRIASCDPLVGCVTSLKPLGNTFPVSGATAFTATILYTPAGMSGAVVATLNYNWTSNPPIMTIQGAGFTQVYMYNSMRGENASATQYAQQYMYTSGSACTDGCETTAIQCAMPQLFVGDRFVTQNTIATIGNRTCTVYTPVPCYSALNPCLTELYMSGNTLCGAKFKSGAYFVVVSLNTATTVPAITSFIPGYPRITCTCTRAIDIAIAIDRSSVQTSARLPIIVNFLQRLASTFSFGTSQTLMAISEFRAGASQILPLSGGTSLPQVLNGISTIACASSSACCSGNSCTRSISSGLIYAANQLSGPGSRAYAAKVIVVITAGNQDTFSNGTSCYSSCKSITNSTCLGDADNNSIPDNWQPVNPSLNQRTPNLMANCQTDLVNARVYAQMLLSGITGQLPTIIAVGIDDYWSDLDIISNQRYIESLSKFPSSCTTTQSCVPSNYQPCGGNNNVTSACLASDLAINPGNAYASPIDLLNTTVIDLSSMACSANTNPCGSSCCGFCVCKTCSTPSLCYSQSFCNISVLSGTGSFQCCTPQMRACSSPNLCLVPFCDDTTSSCQTTPLACPANTNCTRYSCVGGACVGISRVGDYPPGPCNTTYCSNGILYINQPISCSGTDKCQNYYCDPTQNACTSSPKPCNPISKCHTTQCNPAIGICNQIPIVCSGPQPNCYNYSCDINTGICISTFLGYSQDECHQTFCDANGNLVNNSAIVCTGTDLCKNYYCSATLGGICVSQVNVTCTPPNGCYTSVCNSSTGRCDITPKQCQPSTSCYQYVCQNNTGQCAQILLADPPTDACSISGCFNGVLVNNQPVVCSGPNQCLNYYCDASNGGVCSFSPKNISCNLNPCFRSSCDPDTGLCVHVPNSCPPSTHCYTYSCNNATGICEQFFLGNNVPPTSPCNLTFCENPGTGSETLVINRPKNCSGSDPCLNYFCSDADGSCQSTPKSLPVSSNLCQFYICNPSSTTPNNPFELQNKSCVTTDMCAPVSCSSTTGLCVKNPIICNNFSDLCDLSYCSNGVCVSSFKTCPEQNCKVNCTCTPSTGTCNCLDFICEPPINDCRFYQCNTSTLNTCFTTESACSGICNGSTCSQLNNQCFRFQCNNSETSSTKQDNCDIVTSLLPMCNLHETDFCLDPAKTSCSNSTGCVYGPKVCSPPSSGCNIVLRNSSDPNCCYEIPHDLCVLSNPCFTYSCTSLDSANYSCGQTPVCNSSDLCTTRGCFTNNGSCWETPIPCPPVDSCTVQTGCNQETGCTTTPKFCAPPVDGCTKLVRDTTNPDCCTYVPHNLCDLGDLCYTYACIPLLEANYTCNITPVCNASSPCFTRTCLLGVCSSSPKVCTAEDFCHTVTCDDTVPTGCVYTRLEFSGNATNCDTVIADGTNPNCFIVQPSGICETGDPCFINECVPTNGTQPICNSQPVCGTSDLCYSRTCFGGVCSNQSLCNQQINNTCIILNDCSPTIGCNYSQVQCDDALAGPCNVFIKNSSYPGCCQIVPRNCEQIDQCYTYGCNITTGECYSTPKCNSSTVCFIRGCNSSTGICTVSNVLCPEPSDPCQVSVPCDEALGGCITAEKCTNNDPFTTVSCINGTCVYTNISCFDGNPCTQDERSNGTCIFTPIVCSSTSPCYTMMCNSSALEGTDPCYKIPNNIPVLCNDNNPCTDDICDDILGCKNAPVVCTNEVTPCQIRTCDVSQGCIAKPRVCQLTIFNSTPNQVWADESNNNSTVSDLPTDIVGCSVAFCSDFNTTQLPDGEITNCLVQERECASFITDDTVLAVAASISGGIVAAIVIAIIIGLSCFGAGGYAAARKWKNDEDASISSNPLYVTVARGGENPLNRMLSPRTARGEL